MKKYLVIGNPIDHSLSPKLQNWWLKENNIDAMYDKIKLEDNEIKDFIQDIKEQKIADDNVNDIVINSYQKNAPVFNNVAQHINHVHFWEVMKNNPDGKIPSELENKIVSDIGSIEKMKEDFINAGISQFGSGWCWLVLNNGKLEITKTPNGENPIVHGQTPLLGCDVWAHSYYVDYRNRRPDYLKAFIDNLVNWEKVTENLNNA